MTTRTGSGAVEVEPSGGRNLLRRPDRRAGVRTVVLLVAFVTFFTAWSFASPVGSSPDEDYHLASIWCFEGDRESACQVSEDGTVFKVPLVLEQAVCYAFAPDTSAGCQPAGLQANDSDFVAVVRGNFGAYAGDYPGLFYSVMNVFVGPDVEQSVINMRLVNLALFVVMLSTVYLASSVQVRRALVATTAVTMVPLGTFLIGSINPSSWTIISALTLFISVFGFLKAQSTRPVLVLAATSVVALVLGAGSRADASMYAIIAIGAATALGFEPSRPLRASLLRLLLPVVLAVVAAKTFLSIGSGAVAAPAPEPDRWGAVLLFFDIFRYIPGALGLYQLGWLDTALPSIVWVSGALACVGVVFAGIAALSLRRALVLAAVAGSVVLIPTYIAATSWTPGAGLQSRYIYPLIILAVAIATLSSERRAFTLTSPQRWVVVCAVNVASTVAVYTNLRRYVTGAEVRMPRLAPGEWWWSDAFISAEVLCILVAASGVVALALATKVLLPDPATDVDPGAPPLVESPTVIVGSDAAGDHKDAGSSAGPAHGAVDREP